MELRQGKRFWAVLLLTLGLGLGLGIGIVAAASTEYPTHVDFTTTQQSGSSPGGFKAEIDSGKAACIPDRQVRVVRDDDAEVMKSDKTNKSGKAKIFFPTGLAVDTYHLNVKRTQLGQGRFCRKANTESTGYAFDPVEP